MPSTEPFPASLNCVGFEVGVGDGLGVGAMVGVGDAVGAMVGVGEGEPLAEGLVVGFGVDVRLGAGEGSDGVCVGGGSTLPPPPPQAAISTTARAAAAPPAARNVRIRFSHRPANVRTSYRAGCRARRGRAYAPIGTCGLAAYVFTEKEWRRLRAPMSVWR